MSNQIRTLKFETAYDSKTKHLKAELKVVFEDLAQEDWECHFDPVPFNPSSVEHDHMIKSYLEALLKKIQIAKRKYDYLPVVLKKS